MIAYLEPLSGISGDIFIAACIDAGLDHKKILKELNKLDPDFVIKPQKVDEKGIKATRLQIFYASSDKKEKLSNIIEMMKKSSIALEVKEIALKMFDARIKAETKIHKRKYEEIEFPIVEALDTLFDYVGAACCVHFLDIKKIYCAPMPLCHGKIADWRGEMPNPEPVTQELLKGVPLKELDCNKELVTPTGATIVKVLCEFKDVKVKGERIGYGAGNYDLPWPNVAKITIGESK